ncbi:DUF4013 domain-containing protein [Methanobrevibacter sp.]|uniref:DUF4013 domain-containing protein n=1 Tax=Methanobrevibacter sp. TaxID=66852 RepID=UPI00388DC965
MEIADIIKDSFRFPANNIKAFAIYVAVYLAVGIMVVLATVLAVFAFNDSAYILIGSVIFAILAVLLVLILSGYEIDIIKTGINLEDEVPGIDWKNDLIRGIKSLIVAVVYFIVPMIITVVVAFITNVPGNLMNLANEANSASGANATIPSFVITHLWGSLATTFIISMILFVVFSFIHYMANARLANTDSLSESLNVVEAVKDISRVGYAKVIVTVILMILITFAVNGILSIIYQQVPQLSILSIVVTPFLMFAMCRANGLLYSDIA